MDFEKKIEGLINEIQYIATHLGHDGDLIKDLGGIKFFCEVAMNTHVMLTDEQCEQCKQRENS